MTTREQKIEILGYTIAEAKKSAEEALKTAVDRLERLAVEVKWEATRESDELADRVRRINHLMAWAMANIESTMDNAFRTSTSAKAYESELKDITEFNPLPR